MQTETGITQKSTWTTRISKAFILWIVFGLVLGIGNLSLNAGLAGNILFTLSFILGAALPTLAVLAQATSKLGLDDKWREIWLMMVSGGTISILAALLLDGILPFLAYVLLSPLGIYSGELTSPQAGSYDLFQRILFSPMVVVFFLFVAIQAPIPEEIAKAIGPALVMKRVKTERQAFLLGLASGAGFAIIENLLYEGLYIRWNGWSWGGITLLRGISSILHPLCTGIIALGLFRARQPGRRWLAAVGPAYLLSVGLHTFWNGGFQSLVYLTGLDGYMGQGPSFSLYGTSVQVVLVLYLVGLAAWLWRRFSKILEHVGQEAAIEHEPAVVSRRLVAGIAIAAVAFFVPIGAMLGPSWGSIKTAATGGIPTYIPSPTSPPTPTPTPPFSSSGLDYYATATAYPGQPASVFDGFDQKGYWKEGKYNNFISSIDYQIENGKYTWFVSTTNEAYWVSRLHVPALPMKFYLAVDARKEGSEYASYGLFFRSTSDEKSYYVFLVNPSNGSFSVTVKNQALLPPKQHAAIQKEGVNQLAVIGDGSRYLLFINGHGVASFEDTQLTRGFFGIFGAIPEGGEEAIFEFDNMKLDY